MALAAFLGGGGMLGRHDKPCAGIPGVACGQKPFVYVGWFKWAPGLGGNGQRKRPPPGFGSWKVIQMLCRIW